MIYDNKYIKIIKVTFFLVGVKGLEQIYLIFFSGRCNDTYS